MTTFLWLNFYYVMLQGTSFESFIAYDVTCILGVLSILNIQIDRKL